MMATMRAPSGVSDKMRVCLVDANPKFRADASYALSPFYQVTEYSEQGVALEAIALNPPAAIILDENILPRGGLALLRELCCIPDLNSIPIICTATPERSVFLSDAMGLGISTTLVKPFRRSALLNALSAQINGKIERSWLHIEPLQQAALRHTLSTFNSIAGLIGAGKPLPYETVRKACEPVVEAVGIGRYKDMLNGVRDHDNYTYVHSLRVSIFLSLFGTAIGIKGNDLLTLAAGGLLHDVGKISVPTNILNSAHRLSDAEMGLMRDHVISTKRFLEESPSVPKGVALIAEQHHEKLDGTGYPYGLKSKDLNELVRMATIIDVFGALTDRRAYKEAMPPELALHIMSHMKNEVDQHLLTTFRSILLDIAKELP